MDAHVAVMDEAGTIALPEDAQEALGLHAGSHLSVFLKDGGVFLLPVRDTRGTCIPRQDAEAFVAELGKLFQGQPSLEDEYRRERDADRW